MRIDLSRLTTSQLSGDQNTKKVSEQSLGTAGAAGSEDRTTFRSDSSSVRSLVAKAMSSPETRQEMVDQFKQAIHNGDYKLDPSAIAASILDEHA